VLMFHRQNAEQNHNIKTANKPFEAVTNFKHLGAINFKFTMKLRAD
jgi:hypothetical protein